MIYKVYRKAYSILARLRVRLEAIVRNLFGWVQPEEELINESRDYWKSWSNSRLKSHSHWREGYAFDSPGVWERLGRQHRDLLLRAAREAGVTEPVLYQHFSSKLEMFIALIEEVGHEVISAWNASLESVSNPSERLRALLAANPATQDRGRTVYRVIFQAMTDHEIEPRIAEAIRAHVKSLHAFLSKELASRQERNVVRIDEPPATLAWMLINVAIGAGMVQPLGNETVRFGASGPAIQRLVEDLFTSE